MKKAIVIVFIVTTIVLYAVGYYGFKSGIKKTTDKNQEITNEDIKIGGDFLLIDKDGKDFSLKKNLKKKYALIFFGYTTCKTICPQTLTNLFSIISNNKNIDKNFEILFISLDPKNDTVSQIKEFSKNFDDKIKFLTSNDESIIKKISSDYKIYYSTNKKTNEIDHSGVIYIVDKEGKYIDHSHGTDIDDLNSKLKKFSN